MTFVARAHYGLTFTLVSIMTPKSFSEKLLSAAQPPASTCARRCSFPSEGLCFLLLSFLMLLSGPSGWQHDPPVYQSLLPVLYPASIFCCNNLFIFKGPPSARTHYPTWRLTSFETSVIACFSMKKPFSRPLLIKATAGDNIHIVNSQDTKAQGI